MTSLRIRAVLAMVAAVMGFDGEASTEPGLSAAIDDIFAPFTAAGSPGCAVSVTHRGTLVHARGYGLANLDYDIPITPATPFHAASLAKPFTAMAVLLLVSRGDLTLDDELRTHLPEMPDYGGPIRVRHLLQHTSGLRDQWDLLVLNGWRHTRDLITDEDVMNVVSKQRHLNFPPGSRHLYSNTNYTLLAQIVARISGQRFRDFTAEHLFTPLGMAQTFFRDNFQEVVAGQAYGYVPGSKGFEVSLPHFDTVGATSLVTTVADLARWERNFIEPVVLDEAMLERMTRRGTVNGTAFDYGLGLTLTTYRDEAVVEHGGADAGYRAHFMRLPHRRLAIACLCNTTVPAFTLARRVTDLFLDASPAPAPAPDRRRPQPTAVLSDDQRRELVGLYQDQRGDQFLEVFEEDESLQARIAGSEWRLRPLLDDVLALEDSDIELIVDRGRRAGGRVSALIMADRARFQRVARADPDQDAWEALAGTYISPELDIPYRIETTDDGATIRWLKQSPLSLRPAVSGVYFADRLTIRTMRDRRGRVSGFTLDTGRVRGLRFERR